MKAASSISSWADTLERTRLEGMSLRRPVVRVYLLMLPLSLSSLPNLPRG